MEAACVSALIDADRALFNERNSANQVNYRHNKGPTDMDKSFAVYFLNLQMMQKFHKRIIHLFMTCSYGLGMKWQSLKCDIVTFAPMILVIIQFDTICVVHATKTEETQNVFRKRMI